MKKAVLLVVLLFTASGSLIFAQTFADDASKWAAGWKYAFSKEGVKGWKPEFTLRYQLGFFVDNITLTGGVRIDDKRTFSAFLGRSRVYVDADPSDAYFLNSGLAFRRYFHMGKKQRFAFYTDLYAGVAWVYKVDGGIITGPEGEYTPETLYTKGDVGPMFGLQAGFRIRCYKNLHIFLGPTIGSDCLGLHLGIGF